MKEYKCFECEIEIKLPEDGLNGDIIKTVNDEVLCRTCFDNDYFRCEHWGCENIDHIDNAHLLTNDEYHCQHCVDYHNYTCCDGCNRYFDHSPRFYNDNRYCRGCSEVHIPRLQIRPYHYKPDPIFHRLGKSNNLTFGTEIEVELREETTIVEANERIQKIKDNSNGLFYFKSDGSLDNGFEIVSHPMTFNFAKGFDWDIIAKNNDVVKSFRTSTCGFHIHMGREYFTDLQLWKFCRFFYNQRDFTTEIVQRSGDELQQWGEFSDGFIQYLKTELHSHPGRNNTVKNNKFNRYGNRLLKKKVTRAKGDKRTTLVNCLNDNTIEFRGFKGNIKKNSILKNIEFLDSVYNYTRINSLNVHRNPGTQRNDLRNYVDFVSSKSIYKNISNFIRSKGYNGNRGVKCV